MRDLDWRTSRIVSAALEPGQDQNQHRYKIPASLPTRKRDASGGGLSFPCNPVLGPGPLMRATAWGRRSPAEDWSSGGEENRLATTPAPCFRANHPPPSKDPEEGGRPSKADKKRINYGAELGASSRVDRDDVTHDVLSSPDETPKLGSNYCSFTNDTDRLVETGLNSCMEWILASQREPASPPPSRKRFKSARWDGQARTEYKTDSEDDEMIVVGGPGTTKSCFSCPLYVHDPRSNRACLTRGNMDNTCAVKLHLWEAHGLGYNCPACAAVFPSEVAYNSHRETSSCSSDKGSARGRPSDVELQLLSVNLAYLPVKKITGSGSGISSFAIQRGRRRHISRVPSSCLLVRSVISGKNMGKRLYATSCNRLAKAP